MTSKEFGQTIAELGNPQTPNWALKEKQVKEFINSATVAELEDGLLAAYPSKSIWNNGHIEHAEKVLEIRKNSVEQVTPKTDMTPFILDCSKEISGCIVLNHDKTCTYLRMRVATNRPNEIKGCLGHLTKVETNGVVLFDHESRELPFASSEDVDSLAKTIHPNVPYFLDVLGIYWPKTRVFIPRKGNPCAATDLNGNYIFSDGGEYIITVSVSGNGVPTVQTKLLFSWTKNHETLSIQKLDEMEPPVELEKNQTGEPPKPPIRIVENPKSSDKTRVEQMLAWFNNNKLFSVIIVVCIIIVALATLTDSIDKLIAFWQKHISTSREGHNSINTNLLTPYDVAATWKRETYRAVDTTHVKILTSTNNNMRFAVLLENKPVANTLEAFADDHFMQSVEQPVDIHLVFNNVGVIQWSPINTNATTFTVKYFADYRETNLLTNLSDLVFEPKQRTP